MKNFIKYMYSVCLRVLLLPFSLFPIRKERLVFVALTGGNGFEYSCNLRYLSDYIRSNYEERFDIYWMVSNPERYQDYETEKLHFCRHFRLKSFYWLLTAKVVVTSGSYAPWFPFRKGQYLINTWHGGGAYKRIENDKPDANWITRKRAQFCAENIDLFVSSCQMANEKLFRHAFLYEGEILECGMPRNDLLVRRETERPAKKVRERYGIPDDSKILLYAPTYRNSTQNIFPDFDPLWKILEKNGEKWYVLYRAHRYSEQSAPYLVDNGRFLDVSQHEDMQELLCAADMMITDYSSSIWDYSFLYRPCFLYTPDLEEYLEKTGFYVDIHEWPFSICENMDELEQAVLHYDEEKNRSRIQDHHRMMGNFESGHACECVCGRILSICEENET